MYTNTYMTFLMKKGTTGDTYTKLIDVIDFPDLGTDPEMLETTTLSDRMKTFIMGIDGNDALKFNTNYTKEGYEAIKALKGKTEGYAVWFGGTEADDGTVTPTGDQGKFSFNGQISCRVLGAGVNEVRKMEITIAPSSVIVEA